MPISHLNPPPHIVTRIRQDAIFAGKTVRFLSLGAGLKSNDAYRHALRLLVDDEPVEGTLVAYPDGSIRVTECAAVRHQE